MGNKAKDILIPDAGVLRVTFLYVGQGDSALLTIPDGDSFRYLIIDTNIDKKNGGIDINSLMKDLLDEGDNLVFMNSHPHNDHLAGIKELHDNVGINEVWHSGHKPGKDSDEAYKNMQDVIKDIGSENEYVLFGTNDLNKVRKSDKETEIEKKLGDIDFQILSPAEYVQDEIDGETPEQRRSRIHERCGVVKVSYGSQSIRSIMMTGDSDKTAWKEHITDYHKDSLSSDILDGSHHGSRTFFKNSEDDEDVYESHIENISPEHVIISAPKQSESKHDHPHDDAIELYKKHVDSDNIYHLGKNRECVIVDISNDGSMEIKFDQELVKTYGFDDSDDGNKGSKETAAYIGSRTSRLDDKPMG